MSIANGTIGDSPPGALAGLLRDIAELPDGVEIALDILHMHFYRDREAGRQHNPSLIALGHDLLRLADFAKKGTLRDYGLHTIIRVCCAGSDGEATARDVCVHIREAMEVRYLSHHDLSHVLKALFETQPAAALDVFLLPEVTSRNRYMFDADFGFGTPVENMDPAVLRQWADQDAAKRYTLLGSAISMFTRKPGGDDDGISPLFLEMLDHAPDKRTFIGDLWNRLHLHSWSGSLADILAQRRAQLLTFRESPYADVCQWPDAVLPQLDCWIEQERGREREGEESFE